MQQACLRHPDDRSGPNRRGARLHIATRSTSVEAPSGRQAASAVGRSGRVGSFGSRTTRRGSRGEYNPRDQTALASDGTNRDHRALASGGTNQPPFGASFGKAGFRDLFGGRGTVRHPLGGVSSSEETGHRDVLWSWEGQGRRLRAANQSNLSTACMVQLAGRYKTLWDSQAPRPFRWKSRKPKGVSGRRSGHTGWTQRTHLRRKALRSASSLAAMRRREGRGRGDSDTRCS